MFSNNIHCVVSTFTNQTLRCGCKTDIHLLSLPSCTTMCA